MSPEAIPTHLDFGNHLTASGLETAVETSCSLVNDSMEAASILPSSDAMGALGQADGSDLVSIQAILDCGSDTLNIEYNSIIPVSPWPTEQVLGQDTSMTVDGIVNANPFQSCRHHLGTNFGPNIGHECQQFTGQAEQARCGQLDTYLSDLDDKSPMIHTIVSDWPILKRVPKTITYLLRRKRTIGLGGAMTDNYLHGIMPSYVKALVDRPLPPFIHSSMHSVLLIKTFSKAM